MYPVEGNRDVPGFDAEHQGGDVWVTDAAFEVMDNEDWSGLLLTYGGIDKAGHMWGGLNDRPPYAGGDPHVHMAELARIADEQVGRVVQRLKDDGLLDETLIVLTTDHAQQTSKHFFGVDGLGAATSTGTTAPTPTRPTCPRSRRSAARRPRPATSR